MSETVDLCVLEQGKKVSAYVFASPAVENTLDAARPARTREIHHYPQLCTDAGLSNCTRLWTEWYFFAKSELAEVLSSGAEGVGLPACLFVPEFSDPLGNVERRWCTFILQSYLSSR